MKTSNVARSLSGLEIRLNLADLTGWIGGVFETITSWNQRHKTRMQMAGIDSRILRDFGISGADLFIETNKSFWEV